MENNRNYINRLNLYFVELQDEIDKRNAERS